MYFLLGQTNDLRFVCGEDDAPFGTPVFLNYQDLESLFDLRESMQVVVTRIQRRYSSGSSCAFTVNRTYSEEQFVNILNNVNRSKFRND